MADNRTVEQIYDFISEEDDASLCETIPKGACTDVPRNFVLNALHGAATKLGDQLASPSLVLPWLLDALGAPVFLTGLLVPVRRALALLPQLAVAGRIRRFPQRKWFWAVGGAVFGLSFWLMIPAAMYLPALWAGTAIIVLLGLGSIGRGVASVSYKNVLAKTVPQGRRGILLASRATAAGLLTLIAGGLLRLYVADADSLRPFLLLLATAGLLWFLGLVLAAAVTEEPGATEGARDSLEQLRASWHLLEEKAGFRRFILARGLLLSVKLTIPFYVLYAREITGGAASGLSWFVIATGLAEVLSSPFWGRFSDRSSRKVMMAAGGLAIFTGIVALLMRMLPAGWQTPLVFSLVFLLVGFAQAGVRLGRKTYLVDGAPAETRPLYVALSNTLTGLVTLAGGALGIIADLFGVTVLIITFLTLTTVGVLVAWRMPEASFMAR